jgi:hypothetical protein
MLLLGLMVYITSCYRDKAAVSFTIQAIDIWPWNSLGSLLTVDAYLICIEKIETVDN